MWTLVQNEFAAISDVLSKRAFPQYETGLLLEQLRDFKAALLETHNKRKVRTLTQRSADARGLRFKRAAKRGRKRGKTFSYHDDGGRGGISAAHYLNAPGNWPTAGRPERALVAELPEGSGF